MISSMASSSSQLSELLSQQDDHEPPRRQDCISTSRNTATIELNPVNPHLCTQTHADSKFSLSQNLDIKNSLFESWKTTPRSQRVPRTEFEDAPNFEAEHKRGLGVKPRLSLVRGFLEVWGFRMSVAGIVPLCPQFFLRIFLFR